MFSLLSGVWAQSARELAFDVASIKPGDPSFREIRLQVLPAGVSGRNVTLKDCIQRAYGVQHFQISAPGWESTERYMIEARASTRVSSEQLKLMLRALLADRFKLELHIEKKDLLVYALLPGRRPLLQESRPDEERTLRLEKDALVAKCVSMPELAQELTLLRPLNHLDHPVVDATEIEGTFNFTLGNSDIVSALSQQLGLRLLLKKAPIDVLMVDHAERPSAN
jgi:uncharacterized protein (TIGR03435 family)